MVKTAICISPTLRRIIMPALLAVLFVSIPTANAVAELQPQNVLPKIVSFKDMPRDYTHQGPLNLSGSTNSVSQSFANMNSIGSVRGTIELDVMRDKKNVAFFESHMGSIVKYYTEDADMVFSRNLGLGERSFHTGSTSIIQPNNEAKYVSQTIKIFWQEWRISVSIRHYTRVSRNVQQDFTDHEAGQLLRSLARKIYPRFLKVVRDGSTDDFTSDIADTEIEGERTRADWCSEERKKPIKKTMRDGYIGVVVAATGDGEVDLCTGGVDPSKRGTLIQLGDCIRTGSDGRLRVQLADRDEERNSGPSVINIGANSELCFDKFYMPDEKPGDRERLTNRGKFEVVTDLVKGTIRKFIKGWGKNSSVSVKTGVTVCGIRGSDVVVSHNPATQQVSAYVIEGHADMRNTETGQSKPLTAGEKISINQGNLGPVQKLSQPDWNALVSRNGLDFGNDTKAKQLKELEINTDRPGSDLRNLFTKDAKACQAACMDEPRCKSFTWVHPNASQRGEGICWLKNAVAKPRSSTCCISGVINRESAEKTVGEIQPDHTDPDQETCSQHFPGTSPTGKNTEGRLVCECPDGVIWDKASRSCPQQTDQTIENQTGNSGALPAFVTRAMNTRSASPGGVEYDKASVSVFVDPITTKWIAWNDTPDVSKKDTTLAGTFLWGGGGFGTDDFIRLTVTAPDGQSASVDMDKNNAWGAHNRNDPMNVIFGSAADAPNALRIDAFGPTASKRIVFDEGGVLNQLFRIPGLYTFDFSFRNQHTRDAGHSDIHLLIQPKTIKGP